MSAPQQPGFVPFGWALGQPHATALVVVGAEVPEAFASFQPMRRVYIEAEAAADAEADRKSAERAYITKAFDYASAPVGSRDWTLFYNGWQAARTPASLSRQDAAVAASRQRRQVADLRDAKWLDPRCADRGACQSLVFAQESATPAPADAAATVPLQGGLSNAELLAAWQQKLPGVTPSERDLCAFALGVEVGFATLPAAPQTEQERAVPFVRAPHPQLQDALFCYATGDDGASAELIRGWSALVARVVSEVAGDGWDEILADLDEWSNDGWGVPYRYSVNFEDGYMAIYRIAGDEAARTAPQAGSVTDADRQDAEAYRRINTPEIADFLAGVHNEALHQRERWGAEGDAGKTDADWYWLVGYLAGKAIRPDATPEKQLHHIITTAAALLNWHAARVGAYADMRPGIDPAAHGIGTTATKEPQP